MPSIPFSKKPGAWFQERSENLDEHDQTIPKISDISKPEPITSKDFKSSKRIRGD